MKFTVKTLGLFAALSIFAACEKPAATEEKKAEEKAPEAPAEEKAPEAPAEEKAPEAPAEEKAPEAAPAEGGGGADKIGVAECDEYIEKFEACIPKLPEPAQAGAKQARDAMVEGWRNVPAAGRDALSTGCKAALDSAKASYGTLGCEF